MSRQSVIRFEHVSLSYRTESSRQTVKSALVNISKKRNRSKSSGRKFQILDFSIQINHGEQIGIVGRNGSGKSTFLKLIAGVLSPDKGKIEIDGTITPLINIGAGMHPDLSCRDNIYLSGAYLGLNRAAMNNKIDEIIDWSETHEVIESQLHSLSTGTQSRLAFAIATSLTPDIVLVDEVLSVGDISFQNKSRIRMQELRNSGSAVLIVSHDLEYLRESVDRVLWIKDGKLAMDGPVEETIKAYERSFESI